MSIIMTAARIHRMAPKTPFKGQFTALARPILPPLSSHITVANLCARQSPAPSFFLSG
jgi:hypothetical protein